MSGRPELRVGTDTLDATITLHIHPAMSRKTTVPAPRAHWGFRDRSGRPARAASCARVHGPTRVSSGAPSFRRPLSSRCGEALWEREAAGSGPQGAASSESAAGPRAVRLALMAPRVRSAPSTEVVAVDRSCVCWCFGMIVRIVCVFHVPVCKCFVCPVCVPAPQVFEPEPSSMFNLSPGVRRGFSFAFWKG